MTWREKAIEYGARLRGGKSDPAWDDYSAGMDAGIDAVIAEAQKMSTEWDVVNTRWEVLHALVARIEGEVPDGE